jgi:hypothetical protein
VADPAQTVLAGIPGRQRAQVYANETKKAPWQGVVPAIGGLFGAVAKKREEDDYSAVDSAYQQAVAAGRPEDMAKVMTAIAPSLKTAKGKAYLSEKLGKAIGYRSDLLEIGAKELSLKRETQAPVRAGLLRRAAVRGSDRNALLTEAEALGPEAVKEVAARLDVTESGARMEADQTRQDNDARIAKEKDARAVLIANSLSKLALDDPSLLTDVRRQTAMMTQGDIPVDIQNAALSKFAVMHSLDNKEQARTAAAEKEADATTLGQFRNTLLGAGTLDAVKAMRIPEGLSQSGQESAQRAIKDRRDALMGEQRGKIRQAEEDRKRTEFDRKLASTDRAASEKAFSEELSLVKTVLANAPKDMNGNTDWQTWEEMNPTESGRAKGFLSRLNEAANQGLVALTIGQDGFPTAVKIVKPAGGEGGAYSYKTTEEWTKAAKTVPPEQKEAFKAAYLAWKSAQGSAK